MTYYVRCILLSCLLATQPCLGQYTPENTIANYTTPNVKYIESELSIGKVFANYTNYPEREWRKSVFVHLGKIRLDQQSEWPSFYNYPQTGWTLSFSDLGNKNVLGYQYSIMPYVEFNIKRASLSKWSLYLGLGGSYFNQPFKVLSNPNNKSIGGHYTWDLKVFLKRLLYSTDRFRLKMGAGFLHASSGHVELPNFGLNSYAIQLSGQFLNKQIEEGPYLKNKIKYKNYNKILLTARAGLGIQELGGSDRPIDGPKKWVYTASVGGRLALNPHIYINLGLRYRYYQAFYDYLNDNPTEVLAENAYQNSTSYHLFIGGEFILGHVGIDGDIGVTLYRPFYDRYFELFKEENSYDHFVGEYLPTRLGLNVYMIKPEKMPSHNISISAHINANFSTADYSELSVGYYIQL